MAATSIVDYLKKNNQDSSYNARKTLAANNGISDYKGTAAQNTKALADFTERITGADTSGGGDCREQCATANSPINDRHKVLSEYI